MDAGDEDLLHVCYAPFSNLARHRGAPLGVVGIRPEYPCAHATGSYSNMQQVILERAPFAGLIAG
jgi:hypothetical protein